MKALPDALPDPITSDQINSVLAVFGGMSFYFSRIILIQLPPPTNYSGRSQMMDLVNGTRIWPLLHTRIAQNTTLTTVPHKATQRIRFPPVDGIYAANVPQITSLLSNKRNARDFFDRRHSGR